MPCWLEQANSESVSEDTTECLKSCRQVFYKTNTCMNYNAWQVRVEAAYINLSFSLHDTALLTEDAGVLECGAVQHSIPPQTYMNLQQHCYENLKNCFTYLPRTNPHPAIPTSCPRHNKTKVHFLSNMYLFFNHLWLMGSTSTFIWNCFGLSSNHVEWRLEIILTGPKEIGLVVWTEEVEPVQWKDTGDNHIEHLIVLPFLILCP